VSPQGAQLGTEVYANTAVESLAEAFHRVDPEAVTAAIHAPFGRSARHAPLEGRNLCDMSRLKVLTAEMRADIHPRWEREHPPVASESVLDARGVAQVVELFARDDIEPPRFVYHELALTDGAGHEYGPHDDGLRDALDETDRRIGRVLAVLDERGLFDDTLFVVTADHGMAPQDVDLRANPTAHVLTAGLAAEVCEPMIWLDDLAVVVERAADGRTARVLVSAADADHTGERPPVAGAEVVVEVHAEGSAARVLATGHTDRFGVLGFPTPSEVSSNRIAVVVRSPGHNPRHLLLDGTRLVVDLRAALYG
jgi:hypothetical protein